MKVVGDRFFASMTVRGVGTVTIVMSKDDELAQEGGANLVAAVKRGDLIKVDDMFTQRQQMTERGPVNVIVDAENVDAAKSRWLNLADVVTLVDEYNAVGEQGLRKIVEALGKKEDARKAGESGLVIADANAKVPTGEAAEKAVRDQARAERDLKDGRKGLRVVDGGKTR